MSETSMSDRSMSAPSHRIPNLLHFFAFLFLTLLVFIAGEGVLLGVTHHTPVMMTLVNQKQQILVNVLTYLVTLAAAWAIFPLLWHRPFLTGLQWNAGRVNPLLALLGLVTGFIVQGISTKIPHPKDLPIDELFRNPSNLWMLVIFAVFIGPLFEEIVFRGLLLPGLAIVVDYFQIPRDPDPLVSLEHYEAWSAGTDFSPLALTIASTLTSLLFGLIHAPQLGFTWPAVAMLSCVSILLCIVRIRSGSVAASTLVHVSYNLSVFITLGVATGGFRHMDRV